MLYPVLHSIGEMCFIPGEEKRGQAEIVQIKHWNLFETNFCRLQFRKPALQFTVIEQEAQKCDVQKNPHAHQWLILQKYANSIYIDKLFEWLTELRNDHVVSVLARLVHFATSFVAIQLSTIFCWLLDHLVLMLEWVWHFNDVCNIVRMFDHCFGGCVSIPLFHGHKRKRRTFAFGPCGMDCIWWIFSSH